MYSIGVVGSGTMGKNHIRVLNSMTNKFNLIGIHDNNFDNVNVANMYGIMFYNELDDLLKRVDAVVIAVPSSLHYEIGLKCINSGKHVLIEKPIALNLKEGIELENAINNNNVIGMVGHVERYNPVTDELLKIIELEDVLSIDIHRLSPYDKRIFDSNVVMDLMIHDIDLLTALFKSKIINIKSNGIKVYSNNYDYVQTLLSYENNLIASVTASRITEDKKRTVEINTKNAFIIADYLNRNICITRKTKFTLDIGYSMKYKQENIQEKVYVPVKEPLLVELEHFYDCISNRTTPKTCLPNSNYVLKLCEKIIDCIGE